MHRSRVQMGARGLNRAPVTRLLTVVIVFIYLVEVALSARGLSLAGLVQGPSLATLVGMGAEVGVLVRHGEWWRVLTAMFLHFNLLHIAANAWSLWVVGSLVEPAFGSFRFALVYLAAGVMGGLWLLAFTPANVVGAGASGAIFGLLGATVVLALSLPSWERSGLLRWAITVFVLNIAYDATNPTIGTMAHVGGFVGGGLAAWAVGLRWRRLAGWALGLLLYAALLAWMVGVA